MKVKSCKAWAVVRRNGSVDANAIAHSRKQLAGLVEIFPGERYVPILITPITKKKPAKVYTYQKVVEAVQKSTKGKRRKL